MTLSTIEIDFDIHKQIEAERRGFEEPPYLALRRLLNLPDIPSSKIETPSASSEGRPWREGLVEVPHGSLARMSYQRGKQVFEGRFWDGKLIVDGRGFDTLSSAASALAVTKFGDHPSLNGWNYWEAKFPGESKWRWLKRMREDARSKFKSRAV
jgi:hypothetical protein